MAESTWVSEQGMSNAMEEVTKFKDHIARNGNTICRNHGEEMESIVPCWTCAGTNNSGLLNLKDIPFDCNTN